MVVDGLTALLENILSFFELSTTPINIAAPAGILLFGLLTGLRHSAEPDHVAAMLSIIASGKRNIRAASILGALWGIGHTASLFVAGTVVLLFTVTIPERVSGTLEFGVGIMLLFLGMTALTGWKAGQFFRGITNMRKKHVHLHAHDDTNTVHSHEHEHQSHHRHNHKSLIVGMVHGMAGSGALLLVVVSTINSIPLGLAFIAIFGVGSIAGMIGASMLMGMPFARLGKSARISQALRIIAAVITLVIGTGIIYDQVLVNQIFSMH